MVKRLYVNMDAATGLLEVWYRPGTISPNYVSSYQNAMRQQVTGKGRGNVTSLPAFTNPIYIPANSTYTFYVTTAVADAFALWYNWGTKLSQVYASDSYLEIKEGYAIGYPFSGYAEPRLWNGKSQL